MAMKRGEVHWGMVPPQHAVGHEQHNVQSEPRPWLIISVEELQAGGIVIACPMTTTKDPAPALSRFHVEIEPSMVKGAPGDLALDRPGVLLCEQTRVMSTKRFKGAKARSRAGTLQSDIMADVERAVQDAIGIDL
jgi:mRNA-degrading endonuclease toxin of MazEF toxin-antitoxin module